MVFKRNAGKASGVLYSGLGLGGLSTPIIVKLVDTFDWRITTIILGIATWAIGIPLAFVFRSRPDDSGLLPDGHSEVQLQASASSPAHDFGTEISDPVKQRAFWQMGIPVLLQTAGIMAVAVHVMPYLISLGIDKTAASMVAMAVPLVSLAARYPFGWLADTFTTKYVSAVSIALSSIGMLLFSLIGNGYRWLIIPFVVVFGLSIGGLMSVRPPMIREYFGVKNFSIIFGLNSIFITIGNIVSPPIAGWVYDSKGTYGSTWLILSVAIMLGALLMVTLPAAPKPAQAPDTA